MDNQTQHYGESSSDEMAIGFYDCLTYNTSYMSQDKLPIDEAMFPFFNSLSSSEYQAGNINYDHYENSSESHWPSEMSCTNTCPEYNPSPITYPDDSITPDTVSFYNGSSLLQISDAGFDNSMEESCDTISPSALYQLQATPQYIIDNTDTDLSMVLGEVEITAELRCISEFASLPSTRECTTTSPMKKVGKQKPETTPKKLRPCDIKQERRKRDKPEKCHICGRGFAQVRDLKRHIDVHKRSQAMHKGLSIDKIKCEVAKCKATFVRADYLSRHLKNKHGR